MPLEERRAWLPVQEGDVNEATKTVDSGHRPLLVITVSIMLRSLIAARHGMKQASTLGNRSERMTPGSDQM